MLHQLNNVCRRLWRDESGVVLAFTVVVFLTLFVIACSVYAVGETIRQRIELQNAADAAAYSAAVAQADVLSRIAAINQAMSWTYVQMSRRQMDYLLHKWLRKVVEVYDIDDQKRAALVGPHGYLIGPHYDGVNFFHDQLRPKDSWIGGSKLLDKMVWINKSHWTNISDVRAVVNRFDFQGVTDDILADRRAIDGMKQAETDLLAGLPGRLNNTVETVLRANVTNTFNDTRTLGATADIRYSLLQSMNPKNEYCELYKSEDLFLAAANAASESMGVGHNTWFPARPPAGGEWERYRDYVQNWNCLIAEWKWYVEGYDAIAYCFNRYCPCGDSGQPYAIAWSQHLFTEHWGNGGIVAEMVRDDFFKTILLEPLRLTDAFFRRPGALVVGVARRMNNPLTFMAVDPSRLGLYRFFSADRESINRSPYAWAVAAAKAGYRDGGEGYYNGTQYSQNVGDWAATARNLSEVDWDALLIPLRRAWAQLSQGGNWSGESGIAILTALREQWPGWQSLYGTASGAAPGPLVYRQPEPVETDVLH